MNGFASFFNRMNIWWWLVGIFVAHLLWYLAIGTATWLATALLATAFYGVVLLVCKLVASRYRDREKSR